MEGIKHKRIIGIILFFMYGFLAGTGILPKPPGFGDPSAAFFPLFQKCQSLSPSTTFEGSEKQRCFYATLHTMVKRYGIKSTVGAFRAYLQTPQGSYLGGMRCHALAHEIGNAAAATGVPSDILLAQCTGLCTSAGSQSIEGIDLGCMNGAAHTWVLLEPDILKVFAKCAVPGVSQETREGCFHGIGHGLSEKYGGNLIAEINACVQLPNGRAKYQCAHAVFMEKESLPAGRESIPEDPIAYCAGLPAEVQTSCFEFSGFMAYSKTLSVLGALAVCRNVPADLQRNCRDRIGEILYLSRQQKADIRLCLTGDNQESWDCIAGFVRTSIDNVNDVYGTIAFGACGMLNDVDGERCLEIAGRVVGQRYGRKIRESSCQTLQNVSDTRACLRSDP